MTVVKDLHPSKVEAEIKTILLGMLTDVKVLQYENALLPIEVTLSGISIEISDLQPLKALTPIDVILLCMFMDSKEKHPSYLQPVITQYFASNKSEIWS